MESSSVSTAHGGFLKVEADKRHIPALDGLRGAAVILVVLYHSEAFDFAGKAWPVRAAGLFFESGWVGVNVFFALSGFLITGILLDTVEDRHYLRNFYTRRFLRIFPLYYAVLAFVLLASILFGLSWHGSLSYYLLFLQNYREYSLLTVTGSAFTLRLEHLWSLAVEEQFYLVWPFLVRLLRPRISLFVITVGILVLCPLARWSALAHGLPFIEVNLWTPFILDLLAWGAIAALLHRHLSPVVCHRLAHAAILLGVLSLGWILVLRGGHFDRSDPGVVQVGLSAIGMSTAGLILLLLRPRTWLVKVFSLPLLRWFGKLSYGIYIFHYLLSAQFGYARYWVEHATHSKALGALSLFVQSFVVGTTLAWISYVFYERHWLRLKEKLAPHYRTPSL